jgi:hypothetical protein
MFVNGIHMQEYAKLEYGRMRNLSLRVVVKEIPSVFGSFF